MVAVEATAPARHARASTPAVPGATTASARCSAGRSGSDRDVDRFAHAAVAEHGLVPVAPQRLARAFAVLHPDLGFTAGGLGPFDVALFDGGHHAVLARRRIARARRRVLAVLVVAVVVPVVAGGSGHGCAGVVDRGGDPSDAVRVAVTAAALRARGAVAGAAAGNDAAEQQRH